MSKTTKQTNKFVTAVLAELNKSEQDKQLEKVQEFVETSKIDCEVQLGLLKTGELPKAQQQLKKAKNALTQAEKTYEKVRFSLAHSFEQYVQNRENALDNVDYAKQGVANAEQSIKELEFQVATYEAILEDLS
jgi:hypothetical protein